MRPSNIDASAGATVQLQRIVDAIRQRWPEVKITIRADSGFCREDIMSWCEQHGVDFVLGLAKNRRLIGAIADELRQAEAEFKTTGKAARVFKDFDYQTLKSWSRARRVVGKAEHLAAGRNPRFVVTSVRRLVLSLSESYPTQNLFKQVLANIRNLGAVPLRC